MTAAAQFEPAVLPDRFCNFDRLLHAMEARGLDGLIVSQPLNMYYLTGFSGIAHKSDEPRPYALVFSRHQPEHPIVVCADYYLGTFLNRPGWVEDVRPYRAVMMPMDLPADRADIDRFVPGFLDNDPRTVRAKENFSFDMGSAMKGAVSTWDWQTARSASTTSAMACGWGWNGRRCATPMTR